MKIVTVIQARMSSTRLPGKVLLPILGKPILIRQYERVRRAELGGEIVIATSVNPADDLIEELCLAENINCFRGNPTNLLDRHYRTAIKHGADAVVKIPSDCPLIDPAIIDKVLKHYAESPGKFDYVSNLHPATYPDGNDVEVISFPALERAWKKASRELELEHTTPYLWENPELFRISNLEWETKLNFSSSHRWTLDFEEDYQFIKKIYEELFPLHPEFGINDILELLERKPEIAAINSKFLGKYWYENHLNELNHIEEYKMKIKPND